MVIVFVNIKFEKDYVKIVVANLFVNMENVNYNVKIVVIHLIVYMENVNHDVWIAVDLYSVNMVVKPFVKIVVELNYVFTIKIKQSVEIVVAPPSVFMNYGNRDALNVVVLIYAIMVKLNQDVKNVVVMHFVYTNYEKCTALNVAVQDYVFINIERVNVTSVS